MDRDKVLFIVAFLSLVFSVFGGLWVGSLLASTYDIRYVPTESMWPTIPRGSIVVIEKNPFYFEIGDVLIYHYPLSPDTKLMHRLIDYEPSGVAYLKGDNATGVDQVPYSAIDGRVVLALPYAGFVRTLLQEDPLVFAIIIIDVMMLVVLSSLTEAENKS